MNNRSARSTFPVAFHLAVLLTCAAFRCSAAEDKPVAVPEGQPVTAAPSEADAKPAQAAATPAVETAKPVDAPSAPQVPPVEPKKETADAIFKPYALLLEGQSAPAVAHALAQTFLTEEEFRAEVKKVKDRFSDFEKDTHGQGDMSRYLNDRLVIYGLAAANGKVEKIQKGLVWLAMYKEFQQPAPEFVDRFIKENKTPLIAIFQDFKWERVSDYIKNREWRKKDEDKKEEGENKKTASAD